MTCGSSTDRRSAPAGATALIGQKVCAACGWAAGFVCSTRRLRRCRRLRPPRHLRRCRRVRPPRPLRRWRRNAGVGVFRLRTDISGVLGRRRVLENHTRQRKIRTPDIVGCVFWGLCDRCSYIAHCILVPFLAILNGHLPDSPHTKS